MSIKLIISDLDGTLLGADSRIAPQTAAALDRANRAGMRLLVATGRSWGSESPLMKQAGVVCDFVLLNGAECRTSKGVLLCAQPLLLRDARHDENLFQSFTRTRAMGNAVTFLKKMAEKVIEPNTRNGVAREIERLLSD